MLSAPAASRSHWGSARAPRQLPAAPPPTTLAPLRSPRHVVSPLLASRRSACDPTPPARSSERVPSSGPDTRPTGPAWREAAVACDSCGCGRGCGGGGGGITDIDPDDDDDDDDRARWACCWLGCRGAVASLKRSASSCRGDRGDSAGERLRARPWSAAANCDRAASDECERVTGTDFRPEQATQDIS